jgi:hypothetical protein
VALRDANGNWVLGTHPEVQLDVYTVGVGGSASLFGTVTVTATNGLATYGDVGLSAAGTGYRLRARVLPGLQPAVVSGLFDVRGAPASIEVVSGDNQTGTAGAALADSQVVRVLDAAGKGIPRDTVVFDVTAGGGSLGGVSTKRVVTDTAGRAAVRLTLGPAGGANTVTAQSVSLTGQTATFSATGISLTLHLVFTVQPSTIVLGAAFDPAVRVELRDELENLYTGVQVNVALGLAGGSSSAALTGSTAVPTVGGVATFTGVGVSRSGTGFALTASAGGVTGAASSGFSVLSVPASIVKDGGDNQNGTVGAVLADSLAVRVRDAASEPVAGDSVVFKVASGSANFGGLDSAIAVTDTDGRALAELTLGTSPGAVTVTARSTHLAGQSVTFSASATVAGGELEFVVEPTDVQAGLTFSSAPQVRIRDGFGNTDTSAATIVTLAITSGTGAEGALLMGAVSVAAVHGVATFPGLSLDLVGANYTLTATATGLTSATSTTFAVTYGDAAQLRFSVVPTQATAGAPFAVDVQVLDAFGNPFTASSGPAVTVAISTGTGTAGAHLRGTLTQNSTGSGSASFADLSIDSAGTGYTLTATAPGLTVATSTVVSVVPAPAIRLAYAVQPSTVTAGVAMSPSVAVLVRDSLGNTVTNSNAAVALAFDANPSGATLSGTNLVAAVGGVATFADLRIARVGAGYTLAASASGLTSTTSATFDVTAAPASRLVFTVQPSNALPGAAISPAVQVAVQDSVENTLPVTTSVSLAITSGTGTAGASLGGTTTVDAVGGVATFSDVSIATEGSDYTLTATASDLASDVSGTFSILPAATSRLVFILAPSSATAGAAFPAAVQVAVQDGSGNTVPTATDAVTLAITGGSGTSGAALRGTATANAAGGVATFSGLSIDSAGAGYTLTATASGLSSATSGAFTVLPAPAVRLEWLVQPGSRTAGNVFSPAVQVALRDSLGNLATTTGTSVTMAITAGTGTAGAVLAGTTPVATVNGVATFADLSIAKAGTGYTLTAGASGLASIVSGTFSITAGAAATVTVSPAGASISSVGATQAFTATARDSLQNVVSGATFTWTSATPSVATVSASGLVTAAADGTSSICATAPGGAQGCATVTVAQQIADFLVEGAGGGPIGAQTAGTKFDIRVTARDANGNTVVSFSGGQDKVTLTSTGTMTKAPLTSGPFTNGVLAAQSVTITDTGSFTITATRTTGGTQSGTSNVFQVN